MLFMFLVCNKITRFMMAHIAVKIYGWILKRRMCQIIMGI